MTNIIPTHRFETPDPVRIPVRYDTLQVTNQYDFSVAHRHGYFELFFFTKGGGKHLIDFKAFEVEDHSIHLVGPGQIHLLQRVPDSYGAVIHFSTDLLEGMRSAIVHSPFLHNSTVPSVALTEAEYTEMQWLLDRLQQESVRKPVHAELMKSYAVVIVLKYLQLMESRFPELTGVVSDTFNDFRLLAEKEFVQHHAPAYYAEKLNITEGQLQKLCLKCTGHSTADYLKRRMLLEAKRLLFNSSRSIKEIAYELGFEDPSYFNRFFRKNTNHTPKEFREANGA